MTVAATYFRNEFSALAVWAFFVIWHLLIPSDGRAEDAADAGASSGMGVARGKSGAAAASFRVRRSRAARSRNGTMKCFS